MQTRSQEGINVLNVMIPGGSSIILASLLLAEVDSLNSSLEAQ
jgi:hypothetical protein